MFRAIKLPIPHLGWPGFLFAFEFADVHELLRSCGLGRTVGWVGASRQGRPPLHCGSPGNLHNELGIVQENYVLDPRWDQNGTSSPSSSTGVGRAGAGAGAGAGRCAGADVLAAALGARTRIPPVTLPA